jgi:hypothetical protein
MVIPVKFGRRRVTMAKHGQFGSKGEYNWGRGMEEVTINSLLSGIGDPRDGFWW